MKLMYLRKSGETHLVDTEVRKANELLQPWNGEVVETYGLVGFPLSKTSISHSGAYMAPQVIRSLFANYTTYSVSENKDLLEDVIVDFGDVAMHVTDLEESQQRIYETAKEILHHNPKMIPIFLGGDHGISFQSIKAFSEERGKVGIIQFDAHHDLRNTRDGGKSNGTPFRSLLENQVIQGNQLVQIGIRDFVNSQSYTDLAKDEGVTVFTMNQVKRIGLLPILDEAIMKLRRQCEMIYISVDMDVLDMRYAPGCPAIGPGGMDSDTLLEGIQYLSSFDFVKGMDIVEIDPSIDFRHMTSRMAVYVILQFLLGKK